MIFGGLWSCSQRLVCLLSSAPSSSLLLFLDDRCLDWTTNSSFGVPRCRRTRFSCLDALDIPIKPRILQLLRTRVAIVTKKDALDAATVIWFDIYFGLVVKDFRGLRLSAIRGSTGTTSTWRPTAISSSATTQEIAPWILLRCWATVRSLASKHTAPSELKQQFMAHVKM